MFLCECSNLKKIFEGQNLADHESPSSCLVMQNIKGIEISSFGVCFKNASQISSIHKKVHTSRFWHSHAKTLPCCTSMSCTKFGISWPAMCAMGGTHTTIGPPWEIRHLLQLHTMTSPIMWLNMHPRSFVVRIKGQWLLLYLTRGFLFHRANFSLLFPSKGALTKFSRRGVEGKTGTAGDLRPEKWKKVWLSNDTLFFSSSLPGPKEGYWEI